MVTTMPKVRQLRYLATSLIKLTTLLTSNKCRGVQKRHREESIKQFVS